MPHSLGTARRIVAGGWVPERPHTSFSIVAMLSAVESIASATGARVRSEHVHHQVVQHARLQLVATAPSVPCSQLPQPLGTQIFERLNLPEWTDYRDRLCRTFRHVRVGGGKRSGLPP